MSLRKLFMLITILCCFFAWVGRPVFFKYHNYQTNEDHSCFQIHPYLVGPLVISKSPKTSYVLLYNRWCVDKRHYPSGLIWDTSGFRVQ